MLRKIISNARAELDHLFLCRKLYADPNSNDYYDELSHKKIREVLQQYYYPKPFELSGGYVVQIENINNNATLVFGIDSSEKNIYIGKISVEKPYRGKGYAYKLLNPLFEFYEYFDFNEIWLNSDNDSFWRYIKGKHPHINFHIDWAAD